jgi:hypothetical protein
VSIAARAIDTLKNDFRKSSGHADAATGRNRARAARVPELVPIRYGRMLVSPFTFYRGAAAIIAAGRSRAHAHSGDRVATASYLGEGTVFAGAIAEFAAAYADQNERDCAELKKAERTGRITIESGL